MAGPQRIDRPSHAGDGAGRAGRAAPSRVRSHDAAGPFDRVAEEERFEKFVTDTRDQLYRYAVRLTRDPDFADDLVQETYLRLWVAWPVRRDVIVSKPGYRLRTLDNCARSQWRVKSNWPLAGQPDPDDQICAEAEFIAEEHVVWNVQEVLATLPDPIQTIIRHTVIEGRPMSEVAKRLDLAVGTCRNYKTAGLKMLRASVAPT